jgi:hypothetical protein
VSGQSLSWLHALGQEGAQKLAPELDAQHSGAVIEVQSESCAHVLGHTLAGPHSPLTFDDRPACCRPVQHASPIVVLQSESCAHGVGQAAAAVQKGLS